MAVCSVIFPKDIHTPQGKVVSNVRSISFKSVHTNELS